jgi:hypothetical protein
MAHKNLCSGCGFNLATMEAFEKHRIGDFEGKGENKRRCLSVDEMKARGWEYSIPELTFYNDGVPYKKATPTWGLPIELSRAKNLYQKPKK